MKEIKKSELQVHTWDNRKPMIITYPVKKSAQLKRSSYQLLPSHRK